MATRQNTASDFGRELKRLAGASGNRTTGGGFSGAGAASKAIGASRLTVAVFISAATAAGITSDDAIALAGTSFDKFGAASSFAWIPTACATTA
jgi:hypothetical protein